MSGITERVARGAALLDDKRPGWWQRIDLGRLDLASGCDCVVGQVAGADTLADYLAGVRDLGLTTWEEHAEHGFDAEGASGAAPQCAALTEAWRDLIGQRLAHAAVPA